MPLIESSTCYRLTSVFAPSDVGMYSAFPNEDKFFHSYWDTCREQFAKKFLRDSYGFFLSIDKENLDSAPAFIRFCEKILSLKHPSKFYLCDVPNVIFVKPAFFWKKCYMRRSLYSLICRLGIYSHKGDSFENYLLGHVDETKNNKIDLAYEFARKTQGAILRFFGGFNRYVGEGPNFYEYFPEKHGWVEEFKAKPIDYVKSVLINDDDHSSCNLFDNSLFLS
jgi:hypothetical protein